MLGLIREGKNYSLKLLQALVGLYLQESGKYTGLDPEGARARRAADTVSTGESIEKERTPLIKISTLWQGCQEMVLIHC